nr:putative hth la-type rna-binding protein [Quercus suber]
MAAIGSSPSGFSYAQAAKGRASNAASQTPSSKVTSGTATPATGPFSELTSGSNWADDVEATAGDKAREPAKGTTEQSVPSLVKESVVERAKLEDKLVNGVSGVSSPELAATSSTTTDEHSSSVNNGSSSETTWETKSQHSNSEPAWIAERNARQITSQPNEEKSDEKDGKKQKKGKESPLPQPPPKPVVLQDAPPPMVNPWAKRAEDAKAKVATRTPSPPKPGPVNTSASNPPSTKENQRPQSRQIDAAPAATRVEEQTSNANSDINKKIAGPQGKRASDARNTPLRHGSKANIDETAKVAVPTRPTPSAAAPPPVKDQVSWPTPELAQEKERAESMDKESPEKVDDDSTPANKPRKKTAWATLAVTPSVVFETQNIKRGDGLRPPGGGERGNRGAPRGRGGLRGGANGGNGGDRAVRRGEDEITAQRGRPGTTESSLPVPADRASSASPLTDKTREARGDRGPRGRSEADPRSSNKAGKHVNGETADRMPPKSRPTESTKQAGAVVSDGKPDERHAETGVRRSLTSAHTETNGESSEPHERGEPPVRMVPSETRKEPRPYDGPSRGGKRGGRGRGAAREFLPNHPGNHMYANGQPADFQVPGPGMPPSPSGYGSRGNHQFSYSHQGRGGWARGNSRSHSIPLENVYGGRFNGYGANAQLPPVQTYIPGMYDYASGYPMTAMPFTPSMEPYQLVHLVRTQLDYYFSLDNLLKDIFLRKNMDSQGFVLLDTIARFNRVKQLTQEKDILRVACLQSSEIEVRIGEDNKERLRRLNGWEQFVVPIDQRTTEAQNEGPQQLRTPETPSLSFHPTPFQGPLSAGPQPNGQRFDRRSYDATYQMANGFPSQFATMQNLQGGMYPDMLDPDVARGRATKSPTHENGVSPSQHIIPGAEFKDLEPDAFPDEAASVLTVVVKLKQIQAQRQPFHSAASRTFSNGSIDSRSIFSEVEKKPTDDQSAPTTNGDSSGHDAGTDTGVSREVSPTKTGTAERTAAQSEIFWMKDQAHPVPAPPDVTMESYVALRFKALDQRNHAATGTCPYDLEVLYQFWCHFLIRNFNGRMYSELKYYADEDAKVRHNATGLQNLVKFYSQALLSHNPIRDRVLRDCVELVKSEPQILEGLAFKTLRSAWRNGALNLKNRKKLADMVQGPLKERLDRLPEN